MFSESTRGGRRRGLRRGGNPRQPCARRAAAAARRAADGYLRQVDHPVSVALRAALGRLLVPPKTAIARNAPCPCGSGRKYKMCCSGKEAHPIADRAEALYALLVTHAQRAAYTETLGVLIARSGATEQAALFCIDLLLTDCGVTDRFLEMLLDDVQWRESREAKAGEPPLMDLAWVRRELGLAVATRPA